jgi:hypothetical protein
MSGVPERNPVCPGSEERLILRLYDELPAEDAAGLDDHLAHCENCRRELAALRALEETLATQPAAEPSAMLLAETRRHLAHALDAEAKHRWFPRLIFPRLIDNVCRTFTGAPLALAAMLLAGVGIGGWSGFQLGLTHRPAAPAVKTAVLVPQADAPIASVSSVTPQPDGKGIVVSYNRLVPESTTGTTDDPAIRRLLAMGIQSPTGPEVQDNAVRLLADACSHGVECGDNLVRGALMTAARYEGDAELRTRALDGLEPYIAQDTRVRDAVLEAVIHDRSPEVRAQAMNMLSPVEADSSVRQVLHNVSNSDRDPEIRSMSRSMAQNASYVSLQIQ